MLDTIHPSPGNPMTTTLVVGHATVVGVATTARVVLLVLHLRSKDAEVAPSIVEPVPVQMVAAAWVSVLQPKQETVKQDMALSPSDTLTSAHVPVGIEPPSPLAQRSKVRIVHNRDGYDRPKHVPKGDFSHDPLYEDPMIVTVVTKDKTVVSETHLPSPPRQGDRLRFTDDGTDPGTAYVVEAVEWILLHHSLVTVLVLVSEADPLTTDIPGSHNKRY